MDQGLGGCQGGDQSIIVDQGGRNGKLDLPVGKLLLLLHRQPLCWKGGSWGCVLLECVAEFIWHHLYSCNHFLVCCLDFWSYNVCE